MKKLVIALLLPMSLILQSCDSTDVALGAGLIGGVIIGSSLHNHCHGGYVTRCEDYVGYYGRYSRRCYQVYDSCAYRRHNRVDFLEQNVSKVDAYANAKEVVASKYNISVEAADKIVSTLSAVQAGDLTAIKNLGLQQSDMESLAQGAVLPSQSIKALSSSLKMDAGRTEELIEQIAAEVREANAANM